MRACWIQTVSGRKVSLLDPQPEAIDIHDIAHALSLICRFNGHIPTFYSVADHSVFVSRIVEPQLALVGLLHDATEAYLGDVTRPVKVMMANCSVSEYDRAEERFWAAICVRFSMDPKALSEVKHADNVALATEKRDLLPHDLDWEITLPAPHAKRIQPCPQFYSRQQFLGRYVELTGDMPALVASASEVR